MQFYGNSLSELIRETEKLEVDYIVLNGHRHYFNAFLDPVYYNDEYPYLIEVFDSQEAGYEKVKVFSID